MTIERGVLNINTGKPWSKMDDDDLTAYFVKGETVPYAAVARAAEFCVAIKLKCGRACASWDTSGPDGPGLGGLPSGLQK
jgi:hypothetical protein